MSYDKARPRTSSPAGARATTGASSSCSCSGPAHRAIIKRIKAEFADRPIRILDVGCGTGVFASKIRQACPTPRSGASTWSGGCWPRGPSVGSGTPTASCRSRPTASGSRSAWGPSTSSPAPTASTTTRTRIGPSTRCAGSSSPGGRLLLVDGYRDRPWGWFIYDVCVAGVEGAVHHASARPVPPPPRRGRLRPGHPEGPPRLRPVPAQRGRRPHPGEGRPPRRTSPRSRTAPRARSADRAASTNRRPSENEAKFPGPFDLRSGRRKRRNSGTACGPAGRMGQWGRPDEPGRYWRTTWRDLDRLGSALRRSWHPGSFAGRRRDHWIRVEPASAHCSGAPTRLAQFDRHRASTAENQAVDLTASTSQIHEWSTIGSPLIDPDGLVRPRGRMARRLSRSAANGSSRPRWRSPWSDFANSPAGPLRRRGRADPLEARVQRRGLPRQVHRAERLPAQPVGVRPEIGLRRRWSTKGGAVGSSRRTPSASLLLRKPAGEISSRRRQASSTVDSPEYQHDEPAGSARGCRSRTRASEPELVGLAVEPPSPGRRPRRPAAGPRRRPLRRRHDERRHPAGTIPVERRRPRRGRSRPASSGRMDGRGRGRDHGPIRRARRRSPAPRSRGGPKSAGLGRIRPPGTSSTRSSPAKLKRARPGPLRTTCTDAEFARRSCLDLMRPALPTPAEVVVIRARVPTPEKREAKWVDRLIARPEYADYFAHQVVGDPQEQARSWATSRSPTRSRSTAGFARRLAENKPYDRFAAEIVAARGEVGRQPARGLVSPARKRSRTGPTTRRNSSSACESSAPAATTTRSRSGARTTITASLPLLKGRHQARDRPDHASGL